MGFSAKQVQALRRSLSSRHVRTRQVNGRELTYIEGGMRSRRPTESLALIVGTEKPWTPAAC